MLLRALTVIVLSFIVCVIVPCGPVLAQPAGPHAVVHDPSGYSFTPPAGFAPMPELSVKDPSIVYAYKQTNERGELIMLAGLERLRGVIGRESLDVAIPKGFKGRLLKVKWREFDIDALEVPESLNGTDYLTYNAQVPLTPFAIQIKVFGPKSKETELRATLDSMLASLDGPTNWIHSIMPASISGNPNYGTYLLGVAVICGVIGLAVLALIGRKVPGPTVLIIAVGMFVAGGMVPTASVRELYMLSGGLRMFSLPAGGLGVIYLVRGRRAAQRKLSAAAPLPPPLPAASAGSAVGAGTAQKPRL